MSGEKVTCRISVDSVHLTGVKQFDLAQIAASGQCFRIRQLKNGAYLAVTGQKYVEIVPRGPDDYIFKCSPDDFRDVWIPYFDLEVDYGVYQSMMAGDPFLEEAIKVGGGIRILRQDLWETVVSFVISQRNNIPRISSSVEKLCRNFGIMLGAVDEEVVYSFPTSEQLRGMDLSCASLGYREKYIKELCDWQPYFWQCLAEKDDEEAMKTLLNLNGVGEKVANCIMLFGLHRMSSYPRDVWINRLIDEVYHGDFDPGKYPGCAGYVQQLQFFYYRQISKGVVET